MGRKSRSKSPFKRGEVVFYLGDLFVPPGNYRYERQVGEFFCFSAGKIQFVVPAEVRHRCRLVQGAVTLPSDKDYEERFFRHSECRMAKEETDTDGLRHLIGDHFDPDCPLCQAIAATAARAFHETL